MYPINSWSRYILATLLILAICQRASSQYRTRERPRTSPSKAFTHMKLHPCEQGSCYPATGNLLIGRERQLHASSTCGLYEQKRFCIVSHLEEKKKCFWCDSREGSHSPLRNHNISNIVSKTYPGTQETTWWQSENGKENVYVQLDLEAEFHFTHLIMKFRTFRPAAMLIERSYDFNKTWQVYRYFAHNCEESFPGVKQGTPENLTDVVCESRYSGVSPSTNGEVIYRVLMQNVKIDNPYSQQVQNLLKITNLRINFTKLHTLGDDLLDKREEIQEKYYYAINYMVVRGSCSCYGHANRCLPLPGVSPKPDMVHGRCECTHNTKGRNCEKCEDFFNDLPWRPAVGKQSNACKRCNCNNHATSCHFDSAVYEASGRVSGGVCDGCKHNTIGVNCEQCKPFYYRDPSRDIQDPEVCRPCDCDPHGSLDGGICDSITDTTNSLEAGSCHCKTNVEGRRCDICKNGFWNFSADNPDGCEACTCNTQGTIGNQGCDMLTGECTCKRYVTGRDCNQCLPEFWGLSEKQDGCQACDCDPGGSLDNNCDVISGQCKCRDEMSGRTCRTPKQQHFTASLDFLLYEAELAKGSPNCQVVIKEPYRDGKPDTWTGTGFMKAYEGSIIEFPITNIKTTSFYEPVIRYEPTTNIPWYEVEMTVIWTEPPDPNGLCANAEYDPRSLTLPSNARSVVATPSICLEAGKNYKIILDFKRSQYEHENPTASILIDSIVLTPSIDTFPWFVGSAPAEQRRREFERNNCLELLHNPPVHMTIPEVCKNDFNSIGAYIFGGGIPCQCDPTGAVSKLCQDYGGRCVCKPNVVGRRCDRCAPGTYGFGPEGCKACDCNGIGSLDNFCNATTGQCKCRANTYGRECDQCRIGFWNFPNCQRCDCNGHADTCDSRSGSCISCRDFTTGHTCDHCMNGYYGDPRLNIDIPCRQCPCPGTAGTHSFADTCILNPLTQDVECACKEGYAGARCDVCAENYYGNPEVPGGSCKPCDCNNNVDMTRPGNCDPHTGQCKQCLYETTGNHCEKCRSGFYRTSPDEMCRECVCNVLGTNSTAGPCGPESGQCQCYPNVIGKECDECQPEHWKIASGHGCEHCKCDPVGSTNSQCNPYTGQCTCKENFGGRQCNECRANHWGNPKEDQCTRCDCNMQGSETHQCDRKTGACKCRIGIGGHKCDTCARGFIGDAPYCTKCGECFDNWDRTLKEYENITLLEIARAKDIKKVGATGAYTKEFDQIQDQLDEIENLLKQTATIDLGTIEDKLDKLRDTMKTMENENLMKLNEILANAGNRNNVAKVTLQKFKDDLGTLKNKTEELKLNGTKLQERNVQGALDIIRNAKAKADEAVGKAIGTQDIVKNIDRRCKATENLLNRTKESHIMKQQEEKEMLETLSNQIKDLNNTLPQMNKLICDSDGDSCNICGGALCGFCGGVACGDGAKNQAEAANKLATDTKASLKQKEDLVNEYIRNITTVNATSARNLAEIALNKSTEANVAAVQKSEAVNATLNKIKKFMSQNESVTDEMQDIIEKILATNIKLQPQEIMEFANKIKETAASLTNIDPIIKETQGSLETAKKLKKDADEAKEQVDNIKSIVDAVKKNLNESEKVQSIADANIAQITLEFKDMQQDLDSIDDISNATINKINETAGHLDKLDDELKELQKILQNNRFTALNLRNESHNINRKTNETLQKLQTLKENYNDAQSKLNANLEKAETANTRAILLSERAVNLTARVERTQDSILKLQQSHNKETIDSLKDELDRLILKMDGHITTIENRAEHYKQCN